MNANRALREQILREAQCQWRYARPYVMAELTWHGLMAIGFAKCSPRDEWNLDLGMTIAGGRAAKALAAKAALFCVSSADEAIKCAEDGDLLPVSGPPCRYVYDPTGYMPALRPEDTGVRECAHD